ncbi:hypothetical protein FQR65_LT08782 [Abscondita terminalis]|nr:hypothetical protein FQR65_LT08782 [Abscondita terminalis]
MLTLIFYNSIPSNGDDVVQITNDDVSLSIKSESGKLQLTLSNSRRETLTGEIGVNLTKNLVPCDLIKNCFEIGDNRLHINTHIKNGFTILWTSNNVANVFEDCFNLDPYHWYGGPERFYQEWPIEKLTLTNFANVLQEDQWGAVVEPYWLNSAGAYIFVNERVPLFINQNTPTSSNKVCFSAKVTSPYSPQRERVILQYTLVARDNARNAHLHAVENFLGKPTGHPNFKMIERPIWSTWARYKRDVNDQVVREFTKEIADHGYADGQLEIDDDWEDCYGALAFRESKFADIDETVAYIKSLNFRVTLWIHPFINLDCVKPLEAARKYGLLVKDLNGSDLTQWWNSNAKQATYLDFSNQEVREWFVERLQTLQKNHGIDSFKFDAGETTWAPTISKLYGDVETLPNSLSVDYVRTCARLGDLVEVRSAWKTQDLPVYVRMIDKDSNWGHNNGLYTLLTTLMQMNLNGYSLVLPDMVGGNGYQGAPSAELFVRWLQATVFMPSIQLSYVPWDFDNTTIDVEGISRKFINLHQKYAPYIIKQMQISVEKGYPVNAPLWWIAPNDPLALAADTQFVLGENIIVAPVIEENARVRDIILPEGTWVDGNNGIVHAGGGVILNYNAKIDVLPYFVRKGSDADI